MPQSCSLIASFSLLTIKGLAEVKQNEISLLFLIDGFGNIIDLHEELGFTRALLSVPMLEFIEDIQLRQVFCYRGCNYVFQGLQRIQVRDMGLQLAGLKRSPFLQTCATLASFQIGGKVPESSDFQKRCFRIGDSGVERFCRMICFIWSRSAAL